MIRSAILVVAACALLAACGSKRGEEVRKGTLLERVGNNDGIVSVVADFSKRLPAHDVLKAKFSGVDMAAFKANLANELCVQVGGNCRRDASMLKARGLSQEQYDEFVELFVESMNVVKLPSKEQNDLIDALYALRKKHSGAKTAKAEPGK